MATISKMEIAVRSNSPLRTREIGRQLATACVGGEVLLLSGDLGAGKTCLASGIAEGLGITETVTSPTFATHQEYRAAAGKLHFEHFDFYRLTNGGDEFVDFFNRPECVCAVEWAEMLPKILPAEYLRVKINVLPTPKNTQREIIITAFSPAGEKFLDRWRHARNN